LAFQTERTPGSGYGNPYVDSLIWGSQWTSSPTYYGPFSVTSPVKIRYEFFGDDTEYQGYKFYSWSPTQIVQFSRALETFEHVCNVRFSPSDGQTDLYFLQLDASFFGGTSILGMCETPDAESDPNFGLFNRSAAEWGDLSPGTTGFYVLIHELGHGLGLAHPHDGGRGDNPTRFPGVTGPWSLGLNQMNQGIWSMMSYNFDPSWVLSGSTDAYGQSMTPIALDIAALQVIYGANTTYSVGADTYRLPQLNTTGTGWSCIWDAGGVDTISNNGSLIACTINLSPAPLVGENAAGFVSWANGIAGGFTIANGVVIENAIGGYANDLLIGNDRANQIGGSHGDDTIVGAAGFDTLMGGQGSDQIQGGLNADLIYGGDGDDQLRGGNGHDQINGGNGNDTLRGGKGADTLSGGPGADVFVFDAMLDAETNLDTLIDFERGIDQIELSAAVFSALSGQMGEAIGIGPYISYNAATGVLSYDQDGSEAGLAQALAILGADSYPASQDLTFWVVA
jgi:serralysin